MLILKENFSFWQILLCLPVILGVWGVNYSNLKRVKELKAAKSEETQTTVVRKPWYRHLEATPHIIEKLNDSTKQYLQLFTINRKGYMKTKYYWYSILKNMSNCDINKILKNTELEFNNDISLGVYEK